MKNYSLLALFLAGFQWASAQNQLPVLSNVQFEISPPSIFTITYDLADNEGDPITLSLRAGEKGSLSFDYDTGNASGDLGDNLLPGTGKQIQWDCSAYAATTDHFRLMLVADDHQPIDIQAIVDAVDSTYLIGDLVELQGVRHRTANPANLQGAKDLLWFQFDEYRLETQLQEFTYGSYTAANVIGRKIGIENGASAYILDGHFDTVSDSPGCDDNGSAVAGVLEAMRVLSPYSFKKSINFIGFDLEETGLNGSLKYVADGIQDGETIEGVLNFEMIGYYSDAPNTQMFPNGFNFLFPAAYAQVNADTSQGDFITNVSETDFSQPLMNAYKAAAAQYVPDLEVVNLTAPEGWQALTPDLGRSDHAPFWIAGIPALMLTDGANFRNPNYHTPNDTLGSLNFTFMRQVTQAAVATLAQLAEIQHATTWWTDTDYTEPATEVFPSAPGIAPNPAHELVSIHWEDCPPGRYTAEFFDATGRRVARQVLDWMPGEVSQSLEIGQLAAGMYLLKLSGKEGVWMEKVSVF